ncbi:LysE family translocator [Roseobacter sp. YSTF-M11]|uniref:LysE family translocator n=1 Tax=Roseobacter insulae TaxID=2859783 RepID=A0A9X1FZA1_9RHOB|nr:LysE family translocator [Roseobacter insulae]MBW4710321.1 LysE family translocator [Roseobacter insulae]
MDLTSALLLAGATAALVAIPGPNVALFVANTLAYGARYGCATVLGTTLGVALQLAVVVLGLSAVIQVAANAMFWLKWAGVAYLIYLGLRAWRQGAEEFDQARAPGGSMRSLFWQGLFLAMANPKTLIFIAAFLPQFTGTAPTTDRLVLVAVIYIFVVFAGDLLWVATARIASPLVARLGRLRHRLTGVLFLGSGIGLAMARVDR